MSYWVGGWDGVSGAYILSRSSSLKGDEGVEGSDLSRSGRFIGVLSALPPCGCAGACAGTRGTPCEGPKDAQRVQDDRKAVKDYL